MLLQGCWASAHGCLPTYPECEAKSGIHHINTAFISLIRVTHFSTSSVLRVLRNNTRNSKKTLRSRWQHKTAQIPGMMTVEWNIQLLSDIRYLKKTLRSRWQLKTPGRLQSALRDSWLDLKGVTFLPRGRGRDYVVSVLYTLPYQPLSIS